MAWRAESQPTSANAFVFPTATGRARNKENISRRVLGPTVDRTNELRAERDLPPLPKVTAHALRRTYISLMIEAGAPLPYYVTFLEPSSAFSLSYAVNTIAMPLVGGTAVWFGPVIGAILLGTAQQVATVTISSEVNLLIVGLLLVGFVVLAPNGLAGLFTAGARRDERRSVASGANARQAIRRLYCVGGN